MLQEFLPLCYSTPVKITITGGFSTFLKPKRERILFLRPTPYRALRRLDVTLARHEIVFVKQRFPSYQVVSHITSYIK